MANLVTSLLKKGLSRLAEKIGLSRSFAPAALHDSEQHVAAMEKQALRTEPHLPADAPLRPAALTTNAEAFAATQSIKALTTGLKENPGQITELTKQSLNVFDSPAAAHYIGDVTRSLAKAIPDAKSPTTASSLLRLVEDGQAKLVSTMNKRTAQSLHHPDIKDMQGMMSANFSDAVTLMETGAKGETLATARAAAIDSLRVLDSTAPGLAAEKLSRHIKNPKMMRELMDAAAVKGEAAHLFPPETVLSVAKANSAKNGVSPEWRDLLTQTLDRQFAGNPRGELEWLAKHATEAGGGVTGSTLVQRALSSAQHMPETNGRMAHDLLTDASRGMSLPPALDQQVAKFWLDSNMALRQSGRSDLAHRSAEQAIRTAPAGGQLSRVAEADLKTGDRFNRHVEEITIPPVLSGSQSETVSIPASLNARPGNGSFSFDRFEQAQTAKIGAAPQEKPAHIRPSLSNGLRRD